MPHIKTIKTKAEFHGQFSIADNNSSAPGDLVLSFNHGFLYASKSTKLDENEQSMLKALLLKAFEEVCEREGFEQTDEE